ncbi:hypothetical protein QFZ80_007278 [Paenibacillus sp. V4I7]|nr:hypothetical protein [Paenibacillus sp. V4I7]MDQ0918072.1 hypothetical protein [Paenibacillus sp. V4I5]
MTYLLILWYFITRPFEKKDNKLIEEDDFCNSLKKYLQSSRSMWYIKKVAAKRMAKKQERN